MATATVTNKGQVTIPKEVRDTLGVKAGDRVEFIGWQQGAYQIVAANRDVRHLKGLIPKPQKAVSLKKMGRAIAKVTV